ncbi:MAG: glutamate ABC transporter substrate-binding protein [Bowdeniella nasicola]|nr:glutamate ABC transporter substrate-binding protein [Bowdeniella nasicola]
MRLTIVAGLAAASLALAGCGGGNDGGDGADSGENGEGITVGIKFDQPGLGLKEGAEYHGFDVDVARYVAEKLGYSEDQITWVESVSAQRENMIENGQVDMIVATYSITDSRKERVSFAGPYLVAGQGLLVQDATADITGPETLDGKKLCSVAGSTPAERIKEEYAAGVQLQEAQGYSECVELLASGTVDAVTTDDSILAGFAAQEQYAGKLKLVGEPFSEENYGIGVKKDSEMCEKVNEALTSMIEDGSWETFLKDSLGEAYTPNPDQNPPTPGGNCS